MRTLVAAIFLVSLGLVVGFVGGACVLGGSASQQADEIAATTRHLGSKRARRILGALDTLVFGELIGVEFDQQCIHLELMEIIAFLYGTKMSCLKMQLLLCAGKMIGLA